MNDRIDEIKRRRDATYAATPPEVRSSLPRLHRDCYWLLEQLEQMTEKYHAASGLALSWGNYATRELLEEEIAAIIADETIIGEEHG